MPSTLASMHELHRRRAPAERGVAPRLARAAAHALLTFVLCGLGSAGPAGAHEGFGPWAISVFGGPGSKLAMSGTLTQLPRVDDSGDRIVALAVAREVARLDEPLGLEIEFLAGHHFGNQRYQEIGVAAYARWHDFPWNHWVRTTIAMGMGPSYTTAYPASEFEPGDSQRSRVLNQLNLEADFGMPNRPDTSLLLRLQHRSGVFGVIDHGSSDFLTVGLRQRF